jgi:hypothetical protein
MADTSLTTRDSTDPDSEATNSSRLAMGSISRPHAWAMLFSRTVLFAVWQSLFSAAACVNQHRRTSCGE